MTDNSNVSTVPIATYADVIEKLRSADVTAKNAATPWAIATLVQLAALNDAGKQTFTTESMIAAVCAIYKPVTAKGKRSDSIGALRASGWHAMAKNLTDIQYIDKSFGVDGVSDLVYRFIAKDKALSSFNALNLAVKEAVTGSAKQAKAEAEAEAGAGGDTGDGDSKPATVGEVLAHFTLYFASMNDTDLLALVGDAEQAALLAMSDAMNAANDKAFALAEAATAPSAAVA